MSEQAKTPSSKPVESSLKRTIMVYATGNGIATVLNGLSGFLAVRLVLPEVLGTFQTIYLWMGYLLIATLGVHDGLNREIPFYLGQDNRNTADDLAASAQGYMLLLSLLSLLGFGGAAFYFYLQGDLPYTAGYAALAMSAFQLFYQKSYLDVTYRTHGRFSRLSLILSLTAALNMLMVLAVWAYGYYGLCLRAGTVALGALAITYVGRPLKGLRFRVSWNHLKQLIVIGAPILIGLQLNALWSTVNRTLILSELGERSLGLFSLFGMMSPALMLVPTAVAQVLYPKLSQLYGQGKNLSDLTRFMAKPILALVAFMAGGIALLWFLLPYLVEFFLPNYTDGIEAARWAVLDMVVFAALQLRLLFFVVKKQGYYLFTIVFGMAVHGVLLLWALGGQATLETFPQTMLVGRVANLLLCLVMLAVLLRRDARQG